MKLANNPKTKLIGTNSQTKKFTFLAIAIGIFLALTTDYTTEYLGIPFFQYAIIAVAIVLITLEVIKVNEYEK